MSDMPVPPEARAIKNIESAFFATGIILALCAMLLSFFLQLPSSAPAEQMA